MRSSVRKVNAWIIATLFWTVADAQTIPAVVDVKSPEVAAFNRYIETPVSLYTGVPNINIPLYDIKMKGVTVPVSLNYHAGGIRVDQEATWVGLGWSLNYGGEISRKVRGIKDERNFFSYTTVSDFMAMPRATIEDRVNSQVQIAMAKYGILPVDYMPDEFYYSCLGYSGRFMFNQSTQKFVLFPKEDISINPGPYTGGDPFPYWTVQLPNGVSADFGKDAVTSQTNLNNVTSNTRSSWLMKTIRNGQNDSITYTYEPYSYTAWKIAGEKFTTGTGGYSDNVNLAVQEYSYQDVRPQEIDFPNGKVTFISGGPRNDMPANMLTEIDVTNNLGRQIKKVLFYYSYFNGNSFDILPTLNSIVNTYVPSTNKYLRLRLDSVQITGGTEQPLTYRFDYYTNGQMPSKYTFAQDHFGFFNGKANTGIYSLMPNLFPPSTEIPYGFEGGDRRVDTSLSKTFSLRSITYPEGGKTEFVYENNTANLGGLPRHLLDYYQDDNFKDTSVMINFSGWARSVFYPSPDVVDPDGTKYFIKDFTISNNGYPTVGLGWYVSTNYGMSTLENNTPYNVDNVYFKLESIDGGGNATLLKDFSTTPVAPAGPPYTRVGSDNSILSLQPGKYRLTAKIIYLNPVGSAADNQPHSSYIKVYWRELDSTKMQINVGGLRIRNINSYTQDGKLALKKSYSYNYITPNAYGIPNYTSGRVVSLPKYFQYQNHVEVSLTTPTTCIGGFFLNFYSNSILPLETTGGSYAGYQSVDEYTIKTDDTTQKLRTNYSFSFSPSYFAILNPSENLATWEPQEWMRGKLQSKKYFKGSNIIQQEDYGYYNLSPNQSTEDYVPEVNTDFISWQSLIANNPQWVVDYNMNPQDPRWGPLNPNTYPPDFYDNSPAYIPISNPFNAPTNSNLNCPTYYYDNAVHIPYFLHYTGFDKPMTKKTSVFDDNGGVLSTVDSFFYEASPNLYELTRTKTFNSKGETIETTTKYPYHYATTAPYDKMIAKHKLNAIVETQKNKNGQLLELQHSDYADWGNDILAVSSIKTQTAPGASLDIRGAAYGYDAKGNILEESKSNDQHLSYIWDYNQQYPVAEVKNAAQADIAYTSFETDGSGNWTIGSTARDSTTTPITGRKSYVLSNGAITKSGLVSSRYYVVSYWTKNNQSYNITGTVSGYPIKGKTVGPWTYYEHKITGQTAITLTGTGYIDELRCYPDGALMSSYTYTPLVGLVNASDNDARITNYEYDGLERLLRVRDMDSNIIKQYNYQYQAPARYYNVVKSSTYTRGNCVASAGGPYTYTVPAGTYSSAISQQDADNKALAEITANGQHFADSLGTCTYSSVQKSGSFTKNCTGGGTPSTVTYIVPAGRYTSIVSQAAADLLAQNDVTANGQHYADSVGTCTFYNVQKSGSYTRSNCTNDSLGSLVTYVVPANKYSSTVSQAAADQLAQNDVTANGPHYADSLGTCIKSISLSYTCPVGKKFNFSFTNVSTGQAYYFSTTLTGNGNLGKIPVGTYNIQINPDNYTGTYTYIVNSMYKPNVTVANGYNIVLNSSPYISIN